MTLILDLSPEAETLVRTNAAVRGQEVQEYLLALAQNDPVIDLTEFKDQADFDESVAGVREGLADLDAGRTFSLEETFARVSAHLDERERQQKLGPHSQEKFAR